MPIWQVPFRSSLRGNEKFAGRDYLFAEQVQDGILTDAKFMTMVRDREWKLVHFLEQSCGQRFDLANDPDEVKNLWESTDKTRIRRKRELLAVLREWRIRSQLDTADLWREYR